MDAARKQALRDWLDGIAARGAAVIVATHDVEFAARFAERVVLLGEGEVLADGPPEEVLAGGWYFATEVARVLDGAAVTPEQGIELMRAEGRGAADRGAARELAGRGVRRPRDRAGRRVRLVRADPAERAGRGARRGARRAGCRRPARAGADPERRRHHRRRAAHGLRARRRARVRGRRPGGPDLEHLARPGAVDGLADGRLGPRRPRGRRPRAGVRQAPGAPRASRAPARRWRSSTARCSTCR